MNSGFEVLRKKVNAKFTTEDRIMLMKVLDKAQVAFRNWTYTATDFFDPFKRAMICDILFQVKGINYVEFGGWEDANRKSFVLFNEELSSSMFDFNEIFSVVSVKLSTGVSALTHRDYLGAIMNSGINRDFFGDILPNSEGCMLIGKKSIIELIHGSLLTVGKYKVTTEVKRLDELIVPEEKSIESIFSVSSMRLDCIIGAAFKCSRSESSDLISKNKVFVNYKPTTDISKNITENTIISCKGHGKIEVLEITGETKKGRLKLKIKIYG